MDEYLIFSFRTVSKIKRLIVIHKNEVFVW